MLYLRQEKREMEEQLAYSIKHLSSRESWKNLRKLLSFHSSHNFQAQQDIQRATLIAKKVAGMHFFCYRKEHFTISSLHYD